MGYMPFSLYFITWKLCSLNQKFGTPADKCLKWLIYPEPQQCKEFSVCRNVCRQVDQCKKLGTSIFFTNQLTEFSGTSNFLLRMCLKSWFSCFQFSQKYREHFSCKKLLRKSSRAKWLKLGTWWGHSDHEESTKLGAHSRATTNWLQSA